MNDVDWNQEMWDATCRGDLKAVRSAVSRGTDVNQVGVEPIGGHARMMPLRRAVYEGYLEIAKLLLKKGARVDQAALDGETALHITSHEGNIDLIRLLLEHGANHVTQRNCLGTPLHNAVAWGGLEAVRILIAHGADVNAEASSGEALHPGATPLDLADQEGREEIVSFLESKGGRRRNLVE